MSWFETGILEVSRRAQSLGCRGLLAYERHRLRKAEINLGVLGWQQADYFSAETEAQVKRIYDVEKKQASHLNREAEIAETIRALESQRVEAKIAHEAALAQIAAERQPDASAREQTFARVAEAEATVARFDGALASFDMEIERASDARRLAMRLEKQEMERVREQKISECDPLREALALCDSRLAALDEKARRMQDEFDARIAALQAELRVAEREKDKTRKQMNALEGGKRSPYLHIGRCLADCDIAPRNQPDALERVRALRRRARQIESRIGQFRAQSQQADRREVRTFYAVLFAGAVLLAVLVAILEWR